MNGSPLGDPEHIGTDLNVLWGKKKFQHLVSRLEQDPHTCTLRLLSFVAPVLRLSVGSSPLH